MKKHIKVFLIYDVAYKIPYNYKSLYTFLDKIKGCNLVSVRSNEEL